MSEKSFLLDTKMVEVIQKKTLFDDNLTFDALTEKELEIIYLHLSEKSFSNDPILSQFEKK